MLHPCPVKWSHTRCKIHFWVLTRQFVATWFDLHATSLLVQCRGMLILPACFGKCCHCARCWNIYITCEKFRCSQSVQNNASDICTFEEFLLEMWFLWYSDLGTVLCDTAAYCIIVWYKDLLASFQRQNHRRLPFCLHPPTHSETNNPPSPQKHGGPVTPVGSH